MPGLVPGLVQTLHVLYDSICIIRLYKTECSQAANGKWSYLEYTVEALPLPILPIQIVQAKIRQVPRIPFGEISGCYVTNFAPHQALKLIPRGKLTFDERVVVRRALPLPILPIQIVQAKIRQVRFSDPGISGLWLYKG